MKISARLVLSPLALALAVSTAHAAITGVSGSALQIGAPASCTPGSLTGFQAFAWDEQQNVNFSSLPVDESQNPGSNAGAIPGLINGVHDSHFIHFEPLPGAIGAIGSVTFSNVIVGVMFFNTTLDLTDSNGVGTTYPTGFPFRGMNSASIFTYSGNVLQFNFATAQPNIDVLQLRVITHSVPAPGAAGLAIVGGAIALRRRRR